MLRVGYQGAPGAFSESAIAVFWEGAVGAVPMSGFADVVRDLADGGVGAAVLPVENTRMGIITDCTLVLQAHPSLRVLWETDISVRHQLLALPGASLGTLRRVESHPAALAQCRDWLARHPRLEVAAVTDTAAAARDVAASADTSRAAIASAAAGVRYGLSVLARDLQDDPHNRTRFWAIARAAWEDLPEVRALGGSRGVRDLGAIGVREALEALRAQFDGRSRPSDHAPLATVARWGGSPA